MQMALAPQPLPPCVTVAPTMPVRMVSAMVASLLSGVVQHACPCAVDHAHACATEARAVRRERGIIWCILNCLLSIFAGFLWRVEGGGGDTKKDDAADRMYVVWDCVTCIAHQGVTFNPPNAKSHLSIYLCLPKTQSGHCPRVRVCGITPARSISRGL